MGDLYLDVIIIFRDDGVFITTDNNLNEAVRMICFKDHPASLFHQ